MMTTAGRALRNSIDLISNLPEDEARQLGREFYQQMGFMDTVDIITDIERVLMIIREGASETLPK
jgi:hypothetical protein